MHYLALDFGGSSVKCAVMTETAEIIEHFSVPSKASSYQKWLTTFAPHFDRCNSIYAIQGIAISSCGAVDVETSVIGGGSALPYIHNINVRELYQKQFNVPVEIENDACCAALAEAWQGIGCGSNYFCTVVIGSGIGGAIVIDNQVQKGHHLHGGEFGFAIAEYKNGIPIYWGNVASTRALVETVALALNMNQSTLSGIEVFEMADAGDELVMSLVDEWYGKLAIGMYNIQYHVDPEIIILGGAISKRSDFVSRIDDKLTLIMNSLPLSKVKPNLKVSLFGNDANLVGALKHFLNRQG